MICNFKSNYKILIIMIDHTLSDFHQTSSLSCHYRCDYSTNALTLCIRIDIISYFLRVIG